MAYRLNPFTLNFDLIGNTEITQGDLDLKADKVDFEQVVRMDGGNIVGLPEPVNDVYTLLPNITYRIQGLIPLGTRRIVASTSNTIMGFDKSDDGFTYSGTGNMITCTNNTLSIVSLFVNITNPLGTFVNFTSTTVYSLQVRNCILAGAGQAGFVDGGNLIIIDDNIHSITLGYGWDTTGTIRKLLFSRNFFENPSTTEHIHIEAGTYNAISILNNNFTINAPNPAILVDNGDVTISSQGGGMIIGNTFTGTGTFVGGINEDTLFWIIEDNGYRVLNTSARKFIRKIRNEEQLQQFLSEPDPSNYVYEIDGTLSVTQSVVIPSTGLTFKGTGNNFTTITTAVPGLTIFTGGGNAFFNDLRLSCTGAGSRIFNLTDPDGSNAVEFVNVNFENIEDIGILQGFRQGLILNGFILNVLQGFLFRGTWAGGFRIDASRFIFTRLNSTYMFKGDVGQTFGSRFINTANTTVRSGAIGFDFTEANFVNDATFQMIDSFFDGAGTYINGIFNNSRKCLWRDNIGIDDTFVGCVFRNTLDTSTTNPGQGLWAELTVNVEVIESTWVESGSASAFNIHYLSSIPTNVEVQLQLSMSGAANNEIELEFRRYDPDGINFVSLDTFKLTTNGGLLGTRVETVSLSSFTRLSQGNRVRVFVRNNSANSDVNTEISSKIIMTKR